LKQKQGHQHYHTTPWQPFHMPQNASGLLDQLNEPPQQQQHNHIMFFCCCCCCRYMQRDAQIVYVARDKVRGVPHHAKAGNINSAMLKEGPGSGEFILVLDCDMIVHPDFLMRTLGHFYRQPDGCGNSGCCSGGSSSSGCGKQGCGNMPECGSASTTPSFQQRKWVLKEKAAFIQTPQVCGMAGAAEAV
jgi:hypothetical protein